MLAELLIGFPQLLIGFLQIAGEMADGEKRFAVCQPSRNALFNPGQFQRFDKEIEGPLFESGPYQRCPRVLRHEEDAWSTLTCLERGENGQRHGLRQNVFDQHEIKVGVRGLRHALREIPTGLNAVATAAQM